MQSFEIKNLLVLFVFKIFQKNFLAENTFLWFYVDECLCEWRKHFYKVCILLQC